MHSSCQPSQGERNIYYILTENQPYGSKLFPAGSMCYLKEQTYLRHISMASTRFWRFVMEDDGSVVTMDVESLQPLSDKVVGFLLAITNVQERLNCFLERHVLDAALNARLGQQVLVELDCETFLGTICYIGKLHRSPLPSGHSPVYFGVELKGNGVGKGHCDGTYNRKEYFRCKQNCGLFVPLNKLQFLQVPENGKEEEKLDEVVVMPVKVGDTIGFYSDDAFTRGIAMDVYKEGSTWLVKVCPEEEGSADDFRIIPMDSVVKEELLSPGFELETDIGSFQEQLKRKRSQSTEEKEKKSPSLGVNSMVQINLEKGNSVTGTIRWIGCLPKMQHKMAGIELDEEKGVSDGEFEGVRYFLCPPKRGLFVKLESCQPDMRFQSKTQTSWEPTDLEKYSGGLDAAGELSNSPPLRDDMAVNVLHGRMRGIQGHCNSCYMDAALFSLFSCTSVLDSMLYKPALPQDGHVQKILRDKIVNPLRQNGFVAARSVMDLRHQLTEKGECSSFATSEKDPEEFLNLIMHHILGIEPLLKLQSGKLKEQECYCYQIFIDKQEDLVVPNVQQLVEHSFLSSDLKLVEIPSCFIIQMPRFGKEYKMFSKIIPSLELDITDLLLDSPRECFVCGDVATQECSACFKDKKFADTGLKQYCDSCCSQAHSHYQRKGHQTTKLHIPEEFRRDGHHGSLRVPREKLELFAVLCIETSHYVSFVKYGPEKENWMFFDSMADRHGDENGYNIPTVTLCPEVAKYLEMPVATLAMEQPRDMEGVAKRLFCDAYMYMYQSKKMALYK
ncbi:ubiquitin carboxyl-terminal hydrolase CYLD-like [Sceloporus undulatus]|uniref:ubiquitin carboxyl-terminal hydrolase CYLD-like n=1 Tax=Sceloporus undulatus TaxID=8520 RepID=UPI001C4CC6A8|nr:ubiquitin carboxyl-terminal hydrolase CYLD-like [Sceloporus undulatus]XP_042321039.1 ubiquitin carboxyl-terminal hydrolase CYLD-like [Sceloporus undulatus]